MLCVTHDSDVSMPAVTPASAYRLLHGEAGPRLGGMR